MPRNKQTQISVKENRQEKELIVTDFDDESMLAWVDGIEESIQYQWIEAIYA